LLDKFDFLSSFPVEFLCGFTMVEIEVLKLKIEI
jgi:hypothetical protein